MADGYEIKLTDNDVVLGGDGYLVYDYGSGSNGKVDASITSLQLPRRGIRGYSEIISENFVHLMENFADDISPPQPLVGQLWYDKVTNTMKVYQPAIGSNPEGFYGVGGNGLATGLANAVTISLSGALSGSASFDGTANTTINATLTNSGVTPGTYGASIFVIDAAGRITSAAPPNPIPGDAAAIQGALGFIPADSNAVVARSGGSFTGTVNVSTGDMNVAVGKVKEGGNALLPAGVIVMWSGSSLSVPAGWALCDGTNGTPNLRGRFIVSSGGAYTDAQTGGQNNITATAAAAGNHSHTLAIQGVGNHTHSGTTGGHALTVPELPPHSHKLGTTGVPRVGTGYGYVGTAGTTGVALTDTDSTGSGVAHTHGISADGAHSHGGEAANAGVHSHLVAFDNRPEFYAIAFIMKI